MNEKTPEELVAEFLAKGKEITKLPKKKRSKKLPFPEWHQKDFEDFTNGTGRWSEDKIAAREKYYEEQDKKRPGLYGKAKPREYIEQQKFERPTPGYTK